MNTESYVIHLYNADIIIENYNWDQKNKFNFSSEIAVDHAIIVGSGNGVTLN